MSIPVSSSVQESTTMQHNLKLHPDSQGNATARESGIETTEMQEDSPFAAKKRKRTSKVWDNFKAVTLPDGIVKAECIHCKHKLALNKRSTTRSTAHLSRHLAICSTKKINDNGKGQQNLSITMSVTQTETVTSLQNFQYDQAKIREILSHMVIVHELPFRFSEYELFNLLMRAATPHFQKISHTTLKNDCIASFEMEKKRIMEELKGVKRVSITTDLWTSGQHISYMVVTGHYVDSNWNLQKRTLDFCDIPPPHTGVAIFDVLLKCFVSWGIEKKVWTVTVDNATNNDVAMRNLKENMSYNYGLPLDGEIFHVRCVAHIINILVKIGLTNIEEIISKVRDSVKYVTASEMRTKKFSEIAKQLKLSSKKLVLDCCTRWNATFLMLNAALEFKDVFPRYQQRDASYTSLPSEDEWKKVQVVCDFFEEFHKVTELISGSEYPTANLIMTELVLIKKLLKEDNKSHDPFMQEMRKAMQFKFDKYWGSCNLLFSIAAVLDPRNKMKVIAWCAKNTCSEADGIALKIRIRDTLQNLYNEYVEAHKTNIVENICDLDPQIECSVSVSMPKGRRDFESFIDDVDVVCDNTELELYFVEPVVKWKESTPFDAICWWKMNNSKFKILSRMACDVLSVPITTVASESAFSAGGRVIDPHRASLGVDTVQMLLCAGDWLRARYGIKGKAKDNDSSTKDIELD